jgi:host factor-I protein
MLQNQFLRAIVESRVPVVVYLVNGIRLQGQIESYDQFSLMIRGESRQLVYKSAISTIIPTRDLGATVRGESQSAKKDNLSGQTDAH